MASSFTFKGGKELEANLRTLAPRVAINVMVGATYAGAKVIRDEAKQLAPRKTGLLSQSIYAGRSKSRDKNIVSGIVGVGGPAAKYAHLVEFGHLKGKGRSAAPPHPFMRPAADEAGERAVDALIEYGGKRIEKEAAKAGSGAS